METGALVVAAGMSSRMGDFKPMLSIGSISIAQRVVATLKQAGAGRVVVVTGYNAEELERHLASSGVVFLRNEKYRTTHMFDSALIGLRYLRDKCSQVLFTPVDIPLFTAATVEALINSGAELACPVCDGKRGHPILMGAGVIDSVLADTGEGGLSGALSRCGRELRLIEVDDPGILHDADTPEDYCELLKMHNSQLMRPMVQVSICREKRFMDEKVSMLLTLTDETHSVRAACQRMQLSYSSGWNVIKRLEGELGYPIVARTQGGRRGGRSSLTERGRALVRAYEAYTRRVTEEADALFSEFFPDFLN